MDKVSQICFLYFDFDFQIAMLLHKFHEPLGVGGYLLTFF